MKTSLIKWSLLPFAALCCLFQSCQKTADNAASHSQVHFYLTDDPSYTVDKLFLDIQKLEIKVEDDEQERHESEHQHEVDDNDDHGSSAGGWMTVPVKAGVYDILRLRNGLDTLLGSGSFPAIQKLKKIRLTLGSNNNVVVNNITVPLTVKDNNHFVVIKIDETTVHVSAGGTSSVWIDIDGNQSVQQHGNSFEFKASCKSFSKK